MDHQYLLLKVYMMSKYVIDTLRKLNQSNDILTVAFRYSTIKWWL